MLKTVLQRAELCEAEKVISVSLSIGELRDLHEEWVQRYFSYASRGTMAENAVLKISSLPVMVYCRNCNGEFRLDMKKAVSSTCPLCASNETEIRSGRELFIDEIEVL